MKDESVLSVRSVSEILLDTDYADDTDFLTSIPSRTRSAVLTSSRETSDTTFE